MSQAQRCELGPVCVVCFSEKDKGVTSPSPILLPTARRNHINKTAAFYQTPYGQLGAGAQFIPIMLSRIKSIEDTHLLALQNDIHDFITAKNMHGCTMIAGFEAYHALRKDFIESDQIRQRLFILIMRFCNSASGIINENYKMRRSQGLQLWSMIESKTGMTTTTVCSILMFQFASLLQ